MLLILNFGLTNKTVKKCNSVEIYYFQNYLRALDSEYSIESLKPENFALPCIVALNVAMKIEQ